MLEAILLALIILMIIGALVAIETPNMMHSIVSVGAIGFLLSIVFLFLSAPDLAITQIAVEVITLVLLLRATVGASEVPRRWNVYATAIVGAMLLVLAIFGVRMLAGFPEFGQPVMDRFADAPSNTYLREGLEKTGAGNIVTAVLLDFRAYDTLGEASVLFCAVMGALCVLRSTARKQPEEVEGGVKA